MPRGAPSPTFVNFENAKGGTTSLSDLKGKNVYIDIWATWCGPCKAEIPSLKKLAEDYAGKNIAFLSMSIDDARSHRGSLIRANEKWKAMVQDMNLGGIQLFAPNGWQTAFIKNYRIKGIPRFILLDKEGNIVDPNAPRPSDEKIRTMLDDLM
jgi:thiol-disulfide isomerase/thioredoxin